MPDEGLDNDAKDAAMRQGLLGMAAGLLSERGFGPGLAAGIQNGLLAANQSVDSQADRKYKKQLMEARSALDGTVHSQRVGADGFIYNTMRDGSIVNTGVKADRQMWFRDHPGMDPQLVGKDGLVRPVGQPQYQQPAPMPMPGAPNFAPTDGDQTSIIEQEIGRRLTPVERQQIAQGTLRLQVPVGVMAPRQSFARPSEAQTAAEVAGATARVETDAMRQRIPLEAQQAGAVEAATRRAEAEAINQFGSADSRKSQQEAAKKLPQLENAVRGIGRIESALQSLNMPGINTGPLDQYAVRGLPSGQELEASVGAIQNSMLALTRVPGVGSQSDLEQRVAQLQYPSLDKAPEVNARTM